jgi:hypothetical protein
MTIWAPLQTIVETVDRRVCPLYSVDDRRHVFMLGSGVPFRSGRLGFLITAAHVCAPGPTIQVPLFTMGAEKPRALMGRRIAFEYEPDRTPDPDIALIELSADDMADLEGYYQFSSPDTTTVTKPKTPGVHYLIAGYPATRNPIPHRSGWLPSLATSLVTGDICPSSEIEKTDKIDRHHFALGVPRRQLRTVAGDRFRLPVPHGMSGGGVWRIDIDLPRQLATTPLLVGIAIEYHKSKELFVATRIQSAIPLAYEAFEHKSFASP